MAKRKFGATGKFPEGKINANDEGEIQFGITNNGSEVILNFGKPVKWLGIPPDKARNLAAILIKHADQVEKKAY